MDEDPEERSVLVVGNEEWAKRVVGVLEATDLPVTVDPCVPETVALEDPEPAIVVLDTGCLTQADEFLERVERAWETTHLVYAPRAADVDPVRLGQLLEDGIDDYVPFEEREELLEGALERGLVAGDAAGQTKGGSKDLEAIAANPAVYLWRVAADGTIIETNDAAGAVSETCEGSRFAECPCWPVESQGALDAAIETALDGDHAERRVTVGRGAAELTLRLDVSPTADGECLVLGRDVTDTAQTIRELRRSEELHRVTLAHMTDTVLLTDADGQFTYVCPNVHFIFGYTADEIHDQGTIDELLGEDLFDREELAADGVLKNIECTVSDKAGREHTLLVNVREVSIQDGKILYSCRDITKRKQREEALATLQETARDFLYAETHEEIARQLLEDTPSVVGFDASAVYLFDVDTNELRPAAASSAITDHHGPLPTVHADDETLPGHSFLADETLLFDDVHRSERLTNRATELRSVTYIPLGDHGVFVIGSDEVGAFDEVTRELADLLAATAEAALDRVSRESQLRRQDRQLQRQNKRLTELNRINETIRAIDRAIVRAETRDGIDHTVCEQLTDADRFRFAWIGSVDAVTGSIEPRAWAGDEQGYLDALTFASGSDGTEPAERTATTETVTVEPTVATGLRDDPWRREALTRDFVSAVSVPLVYNDLSYGVLTVYAGTREAFDETTRTVLAELGETIASAHSAVERKNALLTTSMTRTEFEIDDPTFVLSRLAREADCTLTYQGGLERTTDGSYVFVTVEDTDVDEVADIAATSTAVDGVQRISEDRDGGVLQLELAEPFLAPELADHGVVFREATADKEATVLTIDVPEGLDVRTVSELVRQTFSSVTLRRKRTVQRTDERDLHAAVIDSLTDRQLEVVQTAYYSGFFESPRQHTGEEIAEMLGFSPAAFYQHVRTVQRKLFSVLFEG